MPPAFNGTGTERGLQLITGLVTGVAAIGLGFLYRYLRRGRRKLRYVKLSAHKSTQLRGIVKSFMLPYHEGTAKSSLQRMFETTRTRDGICEVTNEDIHGFTYAMVSEFTQNHAGEIAKTVNGCFAVSELDNAVAHNLAIYDMENDDVLSKDDFLLWAELFLGDILQDTVFLVD